MANKEILARVKHKRDTSSNWTQNNPVLLNGEIVLVDTAEGELRAKIGDGTKTYTQLPFSDEVLRSLITNSKVTVDDALSTDSTNPVQNKIVTTEINGIKTLVGDTSVSTQISDAIANKVDKVDGKGLSTNDYTTEEKNKLASIAEGAEVNVQSNWNATEGDALILNKPPITNASSTVTIGDSSTYTIKLSSNAVLMGVENNLGGIRVYKRDKSTYGAFYIRPGDSGNSITIFNSKGVLALSSGTSDLSITGVATPTADNGAANKAYVDANKTVVDDALSDTSTNPVQNKVVNTAIANLQTLVGDTSVSEQITNAIADKADIEHTHNYAGADEPGGAANKVTSAYDLSDLGTYPILLAKPFPNDDGTVHKAGNETYATCGLYHSAGTTTNEGTAMLVLGNSIASGSNNNETGEIMLYNAKGKSFTILPLNGIDVGHTYFLPSEAGTLITEQQTYTRTEVEELIAAAKASVMPKIGTIALTTNWTGTASPYYQDVTYSYITETSMVDLLPTPEQLAQWQEDGLAFTTQSGNGTVRVYVSGGKPTSTIAVQVKIQEVTQL